jgi:hypothetical protein
MPELFLYERLDGTNPLKKYTSTFTSTRRRVRAQYQHAYPQRVEET